MRETQRVARLAGFAGGSASGQFDVLLGLDVVRLLLELRRHQPQTFRRHRTFAFHGPAQARLGLFAQIRGTRHEAPQVRPVHNRTHQEWLPTFV